MAAPDDNAWLEQAACRGEPTHLWFPAKGGNKGGGADLYSEARPFCARCPVTAECLDDALEAEASNQYRRVGMWGGLTPTERRAEARRRRAAAPRAQDGGRRLE